MATIPTLWTLPVLLVDDDPSFARLVATALEFRGLRVEHCVSSEAAVDLLRQREFGLAIVDMILVGGGSGIYVVDSIRKLPAARRPPVIVVTGAPIDNLRSIDRSLVKAVIFKPIDVALFIYFALAAHAETARAKLRA